MHQQGSLFKNTFCNHIVKTWYVLEDDSHAVVTQRKKTSVMEGHFYISPAESVCIGGYSCTDLTGNVNPGLWVRIKCCRSLLLPLLYRCLGCRTLFSRFLRMPLGDPQAVKKSRFSCELEHIQILLFSSIWLHSQTPRKKSSAKFGLGTGKGNRERKNSGSFLEGVVSVTAGRL